MEYINSLEYLTAHGIKPSVQRLAVMDYLQAHRTHPSVDEIYNALIERIPTLSKTTVYNTLRLFVDNRAARQLTIDERNACFDACMEPHAHFHCRHCGKVFDLPLRRTNLERETVMPEGFTSEQADLYFHGTCPDCRPERS